jgi:phosphatidylglycerophosphate synthase
MQEAPRPRTVPYDQRIARWFARYLARTRITPNTVTAFSILVGLAAAYLLARGDAWMHLGAAVFAIAVWMDHVDGELARQAGRSSNFGHYFDHVAAMINYVAGFVGAGIGLRHGVLGDLAPWLGWCAGVAVASIMTIRMILEVRDGRASVRQRVFAGFEIEDTLYVLALMVWFGLLEYFIVAAGVGAPLFLGYVIVDAVWLRRDVRPRRSGTTEEGRP